MTELPMDRVRTYAEGPDFDAAQIDLAVDNCALARMVLALTEQVERLEGFLAEDYATKATLAAQRDEAVAVAREVVEKRDSSAISTAELRAKLAALTTPTGGTDA